MTELSLRNCRILVVEDEYMLADELCTELGDAGAIVLGPAGTVKDALDLILKLPHIDGAVLDVSLRGEMAFPAADRLAERNVPFVFTTGYDGSAIPPRFQHVVRCEKPAEISKITQAIGQAVHATR